MPDHPPETIPWRLSQLEKRVDAQDVRNEKQIEAIETEVHKLRDRLEQKERSFLLWSIASLLSLLGGIIVLVWANLGAILSGRG
jgi:hypothetical protein